MKKKIKDGSLYYHQKDILRPVGAVLLPAGLVVLYLGWSYISYIFATIAIPVGLVMFIVGSSKHISDNDLQEQIDHAMLDYDKPITDMNGFDRVVLKQPAPVEISAFHYGEEARYFKRGKKGSIASDVYVRSRLFFTKESLILASRRVSVAELNEATGEGIQDTTLHIPLSAIRDASLCEYTQSVTLTNTGKTATVSWCELVVSGEEGDMIRIPVHNDMDAATLVDAIRRMAET